MSQRIAIAGVGDKNENINIITPEFNADALRNLRGLDCGVIDGSFYLPSDTTGETRQAGTKMWSCTATDITTASPITIGPGMATAYGYDIRSEQTYVLTTAYSETSGDTGFTKPSSGVKYLFVYLEFNLSETPAGGYIRVRDNGSAGVWTSITQDNLITNNTGRYQMPLWRLTVSTSGTVTALQSWQDLNLAETITRPLTAENALYAPTQDSSVANKTIATTEYVASQLGVLRGILQEKIVDWQEIINNLISEVNTALNFNETTFTVAGVEVTIKRLGGAVVGWNTDTTQIPSIATNTTLGTVPSGYRPTSTAYICVGIESSGMSRISPYNTLYTSRGTFLTVGTDGVITATQRVSDASYSNTTYSSTDNFSYMSFGWQTETQATVSRVYDDIIQTPCYGHCVLGTVTDQTGGKLSCELTGETLILTSGINDTAVDVTFGIKVHGYCGEVKSVSATQKSNYFTSGESTVNLTVISNSDGTYTLRSVNMLNERLVDYARFIIDVTLGNIDGDEA